MAVLVQSLNGTNLCRDAGFQAEKSTILDPGVRKNFSSELAVTTNQVAPGMCFVRVTRTTVTPNEVFLIPVQVTTNTVVDTSGNGWIIVRISKTKVNDGSSNATDGSGVATVEKVTSLPVTDDYLILATLSSGVITDARAWTQISENVIQDELYYDEDTQATDAYSISITGFKTLKDGKKFSFKANTINTGACTLSINGSAAKSIRKNYNIALDTGDIVAGEIVEVVYDADNDWFQLLTPLGTNPVIPSKASQAEAQAGTDDTKYTTPLKVLQSKQESITAGESINGSTTPVPCFISQGTSSTDAFPLQLQEAENDTAMNIYGVNYGAQTFTTGAFQNRITKIDLLLTRVLNPSGNIVVNIYAVDGSHKPTGSSLGSATLAASSPPTTYQQWNSFAIAINCSPSTEYAIRVTVTSGDASNYIKWSTGNGNTYSGGQPFSSNDAGGTWSSTSHDFSFRAWGYETQTAGQLYISDADEPFRGGFDGFVVSNTTVGNAATIRLEGKQGSFSGLTAGKSYYLDSTAGTISLAGTGLFVGKSISTTEIMIEKQNVFVEGVSVTGPTLSRGATNVEESIFPFSCGFKPSKVELNLNLRAQTGVATNQVLLAFVGQLTNMFHGITITTPNNINSNSSCATLNGTTISVMDVASSQTVTFIVFADTQNGIVFRGSANDIDGSGNVVVQARFYR